MKPQHSLHLKNLRLVCIFLICIFTFSSVSATKNITFSVDLSLLVSQSKFNPGTDIVYIRGTFNSWGTTTPLTAAGNNVYSVTIPLADNSYQEYKYFINTTGAAGGGWENNFPVASSGNRKISIGVNDLILATVVYNDADMSQMKSTAHFNFYYTAQENSIIDDYSTKLEKQYDRVTTALQCIPSEKINIYIYKDLAQLHLANGYPEMQDWATGTAWGTKLITVVSPTKVDYNGAVDVLVHEFVHTIEGWKTKVTLPAWVNEGVAAYYGRQFSTKDWIKSVMIHQGKPNIADIWSGDASMGYAYSSIIAYFIAKTKGEAALAKFIENMNYTDIGYANLAALQTDWHAFLDVYLDNQTTVNVKFSVDMADMIAADYFHSTTDKVYVKGSFNNWATQQLTLESGTIYSGTVAIKRYNFFDYKFYTNSATAPNSGNELNSDETTLGNRLLDVENSNKTLTTVKFKSTATTPVTEIDMTPINNKINVLKVHGKPWGIPDFSTFNYSFNVLTSSQYDVQKPVDSMPFDCGFVSTDGTINVCTPTSSSQLAAFKDINQAALYYLCQSYMYYFYQTRNLPLLFKIGFAAYESRANPTDAVIKTAVNAFGGTLTSFDVLNNPSTFTSNNGFAVAYAFGEFMSVFKNWGYPNVITINSTGFDVANWWGNVDNLKGLLDDFNRYNFARFLQTEENKRVKVYETTHFKLFTTPDVYAMNFVTLSDSIESAYNEYVRNYGFSASEKLSAFSVTGCEDAAIEGLTCDPSATGTGGTAWSSGLHFTCAWKADMVEGVKHLARHELGHSFQGFLPAGPTTQWLMEGFAFFSDGGPLNSDYSNAGTGKDFYKQLGIASLERGTTFFGHRPTYEDTKVYPGYETDYGYKYLGYFFCDFIYRKGGYAAVKDVQLNDLEGYKKIGYASGQAIMDAFYFDFDVRLLNKNVATLITPAINTDETSSSVTISWTPLSASVKLNVSVSTDNGATWTTVAANTTATSCNWNAGNYVGKFRVKFSAPDVFDLQTTYGPFNKIDLAKPMVNYPIGNEYLIAGDTVAISWANTTLSNLKIEFSGDDGTSWSTVNPAVTASAKTYNWIVPWTISNQCKIRISDAANATNNDLSDTNFTILAPNLIGGPYLFDKNTVALLHFDTDLNNRSNLSGKGVGSAQNIVSDATISPLLGNCYRTTSAVTIPHHANLSLTGDWTIEAWVKLTSFNPNGNMYLLTKPGDTDAYASNYSLEINPWWGNIFHGFYFSDASSRIGISNYTPTLNQWYHVAFIRDTKTSEVKILIHDKNRTLVSSQTAAYTGSSTFVNIKDVLIGSGIDGYVDEVRISNVVRSFATSGTDRIKQDDLFTVSPNPTSGIIHLKLGDTRGSRVNVQVMNSNGQLVYETGADSNENKTLNLGNYSKGLYLIQIKDDLNYQTKKIIIK